MSLLTFIYKSIIIYTRCTLIQNLSLPFGGLMETILALICNFTEFMFAHSFASFCAIVGIGTLVALSQIPRYRKEMSQTTPTPVKNGHWNQLLTNQFLYSIFLVLGIIFTFLLCMYGTILTDFYRYSLVFFAGFLFLSSYFLYTQEKKLIRLSSQQT